MTFIAARWFTEGRIAGVDLLVLHATQGYVGHVEALGHDFAHRSASAKASSHSGVDDHGRLDFVRFDDTAYAAPGANADGEHLEMCAMSGWSRSKWLDHPGLLEQAARWLAHRCQAREIPPRFLTARHLRRDMRGVTTHRQVSDAFGLTDHTDPGPGFPMALVLTRADQLITRWDNVGPVGRTRAVAYPGHPLRIGSHGPDVATWQRRLRHRFDMRVQVDGQYGQATRYATAAFQRRHQLHVDGIVGAKTWRAAWPS